MNPRRLIAVWHKQKCPKHPEQERPCQICFARAETARGIKLREESRKLHKIYLESRL